MSRPKISFTAAPTLSRFMASNAFARFVIGPYGSGKTTAIIFELLRRAAMQKVGADGLRRTRMVIVRNTLPQIKQTVLPDIEEWLQPIVRYKVADNVIQIRADRIHSDWILLPLEKREDQRRLLSLQLTMAWLSEFRELDPDVVTAATGRVGRYPSAGMGGYSFRGIIGESNPFSQGSPWYKLLVEDLPPTWELYRQPGGLLWPTFEANPDAENLIAFVPPESGAVTLDQRYKWLQKRENRILAAANYYTVLARGHNSEWKKVHCCGLFGDDLSGMAVFKDSFDIDTHVMGEEILTTPGYPLILGLDLGRTPAALVLQPDAHGRVNVLAELYTEDEGMGLEVFLTTRVKPLLLSERFYEFSSFVVFDPAGIARGQYGEDNAMDVLNRCGFAAVPAPTNHIEPRLRGVEKLLLDSRKGEPRLRIDPSCRGLISALAVGYKYTRLKTGRTEETPCKDHPASDLADALQYGCLGLNSGVVARQMRPPKPKGANRPRPSAVGWT